MMNETKQAIFFGTAALTLLCLYMLPESDALPRGHRQRGQRRHSQMFAMYDVDSGPDGGDAAADGGDAAADGGDAAADGGDAAADGGDAAADGGDAQVSPLDQNTGTLVAEWTFDIVKRDAGVSYTPLHQSAGTCSGTNCDVPEFTAPNESGQYATTGWTYIGTSRKDKYMFNNNSGGWGKSAWTGPGTLTFPVVVRALVQTPAAFGTQEIFWTTTTANSAVLKLFVDSTPRFQCQYDDGPGSTVTSVVTGISSSTNYMCDCQVNSSKQVQLCCNASCGSQSAAGGATAYAPDTIGIGASNANTQIWNGYILSVLFYQNATWWNTSQHSTDYTLVTAGP